MPGIEVVQLPKDQFETLCKQHAESYEWVKANKDKISGIETDSAKVIELEKRMADFDDTMRTFRESQAGLKIYGGGYGERKFDTPIEALLCDTTDPVLKTWQHKSDMVYLASMLANTPGMNWLNDNCKDLSQTKLFKGFQAETKAMFGGSGNVGADYIPTILSASLFEEVRLALKVGALHMHFPMASSLLDIPAKSGAVYSELIPESTSDSSTAITAKTLSTRKVRFSPVKLALRILTSTELDEDAIIPTLNNIRNEIVYALSTGEEYAIINGDTAGTQDTTDQNGDAIHAKSNLKAWDGYRKIAKNQAQAIISSGGTLTASHARSVFASMGKYAVDTSQLAWVTGTQGMFKQFMALGDLQTLDKFGPKAVILRGQVGAYLGTPIIVSEWVRQDVGESGYSGGTSSKTKTSILLVNKQAFQVGEKRDIKLESEKDIDTDQIKVVGTRREDFKNMYTTAAANTVIGEIKGLS